MDLDTHGWLTLAALALMFLALVRELFGPDLIVFTTLVALWTLGVIDARDALAGFSNPQVLAVALLFIIAAAMKDTGALSLLTRSLLRGDARGPRRAHSPPAPHRPHQRLPQQHPHRRHARP